MTQSGAIQEIDQLIARVALGDRAAFELLYSRTHAKLFGVCLRILNNRSDAEEALQQIFMKIWNRADRYKQGIASPMSWLITLARNHALDVLRGRKPGNEDIDAAFGIADEVTPTPEAATIAQDENRRINDCMEKLEADKSDAVRLVYLEGYSYQDLADRYDVPLNTMKTWLRRSLSKLKECLTS